MRQSVVHSGGVRRRVALADGRHSRLGAEGESAIPVALLDVAVPVERKQHIGMRLGPAGNEGHAPPRDGLVRACVERVAEERRALQHGDSPGRDGMPVLGPVLVVHMVLIVLAGYRGDDALVRAAAGPAAS
jgi:hypothetical protein